MNSRREINRILRNGITAILLCMASNASAVLAPDAVLQFDAYELGCASGSGTYPDCTFGDGGVVGGSFFSFDIDNNDNIQYWERTGMTPHDGIILGTAQSAGGSHSGMPYGAENSYTGISGTESPGIDEPWAFFGNTGMHFTDSPVNVVSALGNTAYLDMSGWNMTWNGIPKVPFGSGTWGSNPDGQAVITCLVDCSAGDRFSLYYTATVPLDDPSGFGGVRYRMGIEGGTAAPSGAATNSVPLDDDPGAVLSGTILAASPVPLPPALYLFGAGLAGLVAGARKRVKN